MKPVYIIHGKDGKNCLDIMTDNNLKKSQCVFLLAGFETGLEKDTDEIKHLWEEKYVR